MGVFSIQDGISKHLAERYSVLFIVAVRYFAFGAFVTVLASTRPGGLRRAVATRYPVAHVVRGVLLAAQICFVVRGFADLGLIATHSVFASYTLIVAAGGALFLGERVGVHRWGAIVVGLLGVLVVLRPGSEVFDPASVLPLCAASTFAAYQVLTRYVSRCGHESSVTSLFYVGTVGAVGMGAIAPFVWQDPQSVDWWWLGAISVTGCLSHYLLIQALRHADASAIQPLMYLQLVVISLIGVFVFGEVLDLWTVVGAAVVVSAGLYTLHRARLNRSLRGLGDG